VFLYARAQAELKLADMSSTSLGEAEDETETDADKLKEKREKRERWRIRGEQIKAEIREALMFSLMPEHMKAAFVEVHGWPGEDTVHEQLEPLQGVSRRVANSLLTLIEAQTFSRGGWSNSALWRQLDQDGKLARRRLVLTARGEG
jgi:hypothetical protein